jgi:hypothetical protein
MIDLSKGIFWGLIAFWAVCLGGCGAAATGDEQAADSTPAENVASQSQALDAMEDRPPAAAVVRAAIDGNSTGKELWVFACNSSFQLMVNIQHSHGTVAGPWTGWTRVAKTKSCAGTPAVAYFENDGDGVGDDVAVYWKDWNSELYEARFLAAGGSSVTNLSTTLGLGRILSQPVVANLGNDTGAVDAVSIVVIKRDAADELWTVDYAGGAWTLYPMLRADGSQAYGVGRAFTAFGPPSGVYDRTFISAYAGNNVHVIYARRYWTNSYVEYAKTKTAQVKGQLSIAHYNLYDGDTTCYPRGCAMYRDATTNYLMYAPLESGGHITSKFKRWEDKHPEAAQEPNHFARMGGSLAVSPDRNWFIHGLARSEDGWPMLFTFSTGSSVRCRFTKQTLSAPVQVMNSYYQAIYEDTDYNLQLLNYFGECRGDNPGSRDLGLTPFNP